MFLRSIVASFSLSLVLVVGSLGLGGCAATAEDGEQTADDTTADDTSVNVNVSEEGSAVTPKMIGYVPRVVRADLRAAGASCVGSMCTLNGQGWDCSGAGYCSQIAR